VNARLPTKTSSLFQSAKQGARNSDIYSPNHRVARTIAIFGTQLPPAAPTLQSRAEGWQSCWEGLFRRRPPALPAVELSSNRSDLTLHFSPLSKVNGTPVRSGHTDIVDLTEVEEEGEVDERAAPDRSVTTEIPRVLRPGDTASRDVHRPPRRREPRASPVLMGPVQGVKGQHTGPSITTKEALVKMASQCTATSRLQLGCFRWSSRNAKFKPI
jgi:hypothetical protein